MFGFMFRVSVWILVLQLGGLVLLAGGMWVSVGGSSFLHILVPFSRQVQLFVNTGFFCVSVGAVLVLLGLLGSCGARKESKCLLIAVSPHVTRATSRLCYKIKLRDSSE